MPGGGGEPRGHETVPGEGGAYWSLCVPKGGARSGLPQEPLWGRHAPENSSTKADSLRIYGFQGEAAEEGEGFTRISYRPIVHCWGLC